MTNDQRLTTDNGFTVIEILMVIVVMTIVIGIVIISLSKLNSSQALDKNTSLVVSILDQARSLTLSSKDSSQYGVYLEASSMTLFKGSTYALSDPLNVVTTIDSKVGIRNITLLGGGSAVVFQRLTGNTGQPGTLEIFIKDSSTIMKVINISGTGVISITP